MLHTHTLTHIGHQPPEQIPPTPAAGIFVKFFNPRLQILHHVKIPDIK